MCIEILEILIGIAHWQILSIFDRVSARDMIIVGNFFTFLFLIFYLFIFSAKEATKQKIEGIIRKQFGQEIENKETEIMNISEVMEKVHSTLFVHKTYCYSHFNISLWWFK